MADNGWHGSEDLEDRLVPIDNLILLPGNPRQGDVGAVSQSLERFGQMKPIVVDTDGVILAGNHTYLAARALGWSQIAVTVGLLEGAEKSAYALADNRLSDLASYDDSALLAMIDHVRVETGDLTGTGYESDWVEELRDEVSTALNLRIGDERYTPAWVFDGMAVRFDIDLAAPAGGVSWIPADRYYTKEDDALTYSWEGETAWCNPPFSAAAVFGRKFLAEVDQGVWLGPISHSTDYVMGLITKARLVWIPRGMDFHLVGGPPEGIGFPIFLAGLGELGETALRNLHGSRPDGGVLLESV